MTDSRDALKGYVPQLARQGDFGRILEGVGSQFGRKYACTRLEQQHQGRRGACMATLADRMHTATGLGARSINQQCGRGACALCL